MQDFQQTLARHGVTVSGPAAFFKPARRGASRQDAKPVPDAGLGHDEFGHLGIRLDLFSQACDVDPQVVCLLVRVRAPDLAQDLAMGEMIARMMGRLVRAGTGSGLMVATIIAPDVGFARIQTGVRSGEQ